MATPTSRGNLAPSTWRVDGRKIAVDAGTTVPTDAVAGYDQGCVFIETDATVAANSIRMNYGSVTSANFDIGQLVRNTGNDAAGVLVAGGTTVPTDATAGYAVNCLFINQSGATTVTRLYVNVGTAASCNFDATDLTV